MEATQPEGTFRSESQEMSRRTALKGVVISGAAAVLFAGDRRVVQAQEATPDAGECVAMAPPFDESGIAFVPLLVGGVVRDMPPGPIEVRISRLAMVPGTVIEATAVPYPALMYIETGTTACPGAPGRIVYSPDGTMVEESTTTGVQYTPASSTQYIPADIPDGAGNEGTELMSSIIIEFVPIEQNATPTA
jgi:hypothetical protein